MAENEPELTEEQREILRGVDNWVRTLLVRSGIKIVNFRKEDGEVDAYGLLNTPGKYVAIVDAMHQAIAAASLGMPLPKFAPPPERSVKRKRKR